MESVLLVRHALAGSNADGVVSSVPPGVGLTEKGEEQARSLGAELAAVEIDLGLWTELVRTRQTLDLALAGQEFPREVIPGLNEIRFGSFEGGPLSAYRAWAFEAPPEEPCPGGGESRAAAVARYAEGYGELLGRPERILIVVGHALPIRYALDAALGLAPAARMTPVEHAFPYRLSARELERAVGLLAEWVASPRFRDPSNG